MIFLPDRGNKRSIRVFYTVIYLSHNGLRGLEGKDRLEAAAFMVGFEDISGTPIASGITIGCVYEYFAGLALVFTTHTL
mgnify:CR=1 FL=1